jgi:uncharacterized protein with PhoU and TrkA domain
MRKRGRCFFFFRRRERKIHAGDFFFVTGERKSAPNIDGEGKSAPNLAGPHHISMTSSSTTSWTKIRRGSRRIRCRSSDTYIRISYTILGRKKERKKRTYLFSFFKKKMHLATWPCTWLNVVRLNNHVYKKPRG